MRISDWSSDVCSSDLLLCRETHDHPDKLSMVDFEEWYDSHCSKVVSLKRFAESRICFVVFGRLWVVFHEQWGSLRQRLGISPIPLTWCHSASNLPRAPLMVYGMSRLVATLPKIGRAQV